MTIKAMVKIVLGLSTIILTSGCSGYEFQSSEAPETTKSESGTPTPSDKAEPVFRTTSSGLMPQFGNPSVGLRMDSDGKVYEKYLDGSEALVFQVSLDFVNDLIYKIDRVGSMNQYSLVALDTAMVTCDIAWTKEVYVNGKFVVFDKQVNCGNRFLLRRVVDCSAGCSSEVDMYEVTKDIEKLINYIKASLNPTK